MRSIRAHLLALAVASAALAALAFVLIAYDVQRAARQQTRLQLQETANLLSLAVDGELKGALGILAALSSSRAAAQREWNIVDQQARSALQREDVWVVVQDRSGRQLVNTDLPRGAPLPSLPPSQSMWRAIADGKPHICDLSQGAVGREVVCVDRLVRDDQGTEYAMSVVFRPRFFHPVVSRMQVRDGHVAALLDHSGRLIWRNINPEKFVGKPATPDVRLAVRTSADGTMESTTLEGTRTVAAFRRSPVSRWSVIVGTPLSDASPGLQKAQWFGSAAAVALLALVGLLALYLARRVSKGVQLLGQTVESGRLTESQAPRTTGFEELDQLQAALRAAATAQAESEERFRRIFEQSSDLIVTADLDQVITDCNPSAAAAVGFPRREVIGRKISDFVSPEDFQRTTEQLRHKLQSGGTTRYDVRVRSSAGEWLFWEINSGLTYDDEAHPVGLHVVGRDVTERKRWENHQQLLVGELNHRVKNTLAIVQSLSHQTFRSGAPTREAIAAFEARLGALAAAHNLLTSENWESAPLRNVVLQALAPFCGQDTCTVEGPDLRLHPQTAVTMSLAVHELATNAAKYGALSNDAGRVIVSWTHEDDVLEFEWREEGGPPVSEPTSAGFGTRMIRRALAAELKGAVSLYFERSGVVCHVRADLMTSEPL